MLVTFRHYGGPVRIKPPARSSATTF